MSTTRFWCELAAIPHGVGERVAITVDDGRISGVDVDVDPAPGDTRRAGLTLAGLANAHSHAFHRALRHRTHGDGGTFWTWREQMYRAAASLDPDSYRRLATAVFAEMALAGVTSVGEFHYLHHRPDGGRYDDPNEMGAALLDAATAAGIRITLLDTVYLHGGLDDGGYTPLGDHQRRFGDRDAEAWATRVEALSPAEGQRIGAAVHSVRAVDPAASAAVADWARAGGAPLHAHVSEQPAENEQCLAHLGATPVAVLDGAGVLDTAFTAVHATHLTDDDLATLGTAGAGVCLCPTTERDLADGIGPAAALRAVGASLCLGSDSHAVIDLFEEARAVELDERLDTGRRGIHDPLALLAMATVNGQAALGWDDAGTLEVGARADLVTVRLDSVRTAGATADTAIAAATFSATAADVTDVVVDGRTVVDDGRHVTVDVANELTTAIARVMGG